MNRRMAGVRADVAVKLVGDDRDQLIASGQELEEIDGGVPGAADVKLEQVTGLPVLSIVPRREMLASYGVSMATVQDIVATATGGQQAGQIFDGDRRFPVVVRLPEALRTDIVRLDNLPVPLASAATVPLRELPDRPHAAGPRTETGREWRGCV